ncbi:MAG: zinc ribbon domain-containing protein [Lautropia sp.]|nr:zinc ribbon domain-containing protein [Lautropia sp.]
MPIYAYRCSDCGFQQDVLQKISEPPLTVCSSCGHESFSKQLSAPAFQLKGTGWYVTDFRDNGKKPAEGGANDSGNRQGSGSGEASSAASSASAAPAATPPAPAPAASAPAPAASAPKAGE